MREGCFAVDADRSDYQLHLALGDGTLDGLVEELASAALGCLSPAGADGASQQAVRQAIADRLRSRVVAYDLCGLFSQCHLSDRFNPWREG